MKPTILGVHGYNSNGKYMRRLEESVNRARFPFEVFEYGKKWIGPVGNLLANRIRWQDVAENLALTVHVKQRPTILMTHSNGTMLAYHAARKVENIVGVISFNGALDSGAEFPCWVINCFHKDDWILNYFARWRPGSYWGDFGQEPQESAEVNIDLKRYYSGWNVHSKFLDFADDIMPEVFHHVRILLNQ